MSIFEEEKMTLVDVVFQVASHSSHTIVDTVAGDVEDFGSFADDLLKIALSGHFTLECD